MSDYQYLSPMGVGQPGSVDGGAQAIPFRNAQDASLSGLGGFTPESSYPDGYLGTIQSRREDRLLDNLKGQLNQRQYQRGVHVGEKINASEYFWPPELSDQRGLVRQSQGVVQPDNTIASPRSAPLGSVLEQMIASNASELPVGPRGRMRPPPAPLDVNPAVAVNMRHLAPNWR